MSRETNPVRCIYALPKDLDPLDRLPSNRGRSSAVHKLIRAFGLLREGEERIVDPTGNRAELLRTGLASRAELEEFHDHEYVDSLLQGYDSIDDVDVDQAESDLEISAHQSTKDHSRGADAEDCEEFGLEHDCPRFPKMAQYVLAVAGAALETSRELREDRADIGIVWDGGRHHAQRSAAAGFCYVNDAALAISELRRQPENTGLKKLNRVLYLDMLDIHHGDGVEQAFWTTSRVLTLSVHFHDPEGGFYPLSGAAESSGPASPSPAASHALTYHFGRQLRYAIWDPIGGRLWGFGLKEMGDCLETILKDCVAHRRKVLLLGGGGYHTPNVARAWAYFTSIALGKKFDLEETEIPLGVEGDVEYGPTYTLDVPGLERPPSEHNQSDELSGVDRVFKGDPQLQQVIIELDRHLFDSRLSNSPEIPQPQVLMADAIQANTLTQTQCSAEF
ncbi:hypothetical protein H4Q26_011229 [Puccinia striiformis f. sp. tritici PST-130]|nr:hypothetical protein H4Q26_011229 [Puccinia striiformis f. sp. tritici PST-130]